MTSSPDLHVMTFNLRCATSERVHPWPRRRPVVRSLLAQTEPHVLATQEGLPDQLRELGEDLPAHYDSVGTGREGGGRGEAMQVFFDTRRLSAVEHAHFWLSDTPEVPGSQTWGGDWPRMVTWVRFVDRVTDRSFVVLDTHLEAFSEEARARSASLIRERLPSDVPVLLTGDFNEPAGEGGAVYDALVTHGPLADTWLTASERGPAYATFHDYGELLLDGERIDWILASPDISVVSSTADTFAVDDVRPSDHLPVRAVVRLPAGDLSWQRGN